MLDIHPFTDLFHYEPWTVQKTQFQVVLFNVLYYKKNHKKMT